jgi:riboflavin kinase/FMN adenylyltransferase
MRERSDPGRAAPCVLTIGAFDGVHVGHQSLLRGAAERARSLGLRSVALTFSPLPRLALHPDSGDLCLMTTEDRLAHIAGCGVDETIVERFDRSLWQLSARDFFERPQLRSRLRLLVVGSNFRIGRGREAGAPELERLGREQGWGVEVLPTLEIEGARVSSSRIREALRERGDVELAARLLGRPFELAGEVARGAGRGRSIGVPTANVRPPGGLLVPRDGVYYCSALPGDSPLGEVPAVVNIGVRPTFDHGARSVEAHLLGWTGDLYGRPLRLRFRARLRDERKFDGPHALVEQIRRDIADAEALSTHEAV